MYILIARYNDGSESGDIVPVAVSDSIDKLKDYARENVSKYWRYRGEVQEWRDLHGRLQAAMYNPNNYKSGYAEAYFHIQKIESVF